MLRTALACFGTGLLALSAGAAETPQQLEFFEAKIRPVLAERCLVCHSDAAETAKKLKGGLKLDSAAGWRVGGDSGPAIVPGKPGASLLLKSLKYEGNSHMPPEGKLPATVIADFEAWIGAGAADPRGAAATKKRIGLSVAEGRKFWAYRAVSAPPIPATADEAWPNGDLDRFILAKLEAKGRKPGADADRPTLLRRAYFDLIGLPPTPEEVDAFVADRDPRAYETRIDALLAKPEFGERWGRHWLDVARYAESLTLRGFILKEAWRYRDYVIESFNADRPFDGFIREQIAGDLMAAKSPEERRRQIVATAFLAMGNHNLEEQDKRVLRMDIVDEMLDVVSKGFLGQTVTCARCHDHKFDPIPTKDYYALAGIFRNVQATEDANVSKWIEVPLPAEPAHEAELKKHEAAVAALQVKIAAAKSLAAGKPGAKGALAVADVKGLVVDDAQAKKVGAWKDSTSTGTYIGAGYVHDDDAGKGDKSLTFAVELPATGRYEVRLSYSAGASRASNAPVTVFGADGEKLIAVDMRKAPPVEGRYVSLGEHRFEKGGQCFVIVANEGTKGHVTADAVVFVPLDTKEAKKEEPPPKGADPDVLKTLEGELKRLLATGPKRAMALSVVERAKIEEAKIHIRGLVSNPGAVAPRGVLQVAPTAAPAMPQDRSGRLELAGWIASADNPLTARVFVNRAWHWVFGSGLVRTVDNFGTTGEAPSHPELLDHLAVRFVAEGWSVKKLVRTLVLSHTYRQASGPPDAADPENRLFGRANRKRLDAEVIRDSMLSIGGAPSGERGGPTFPAKLETDYGYRADDARRSVYLPVFRNSLPEIFEAFDFADPSVVVGARNAGTVAPQALYLLNNPFPIAEANLAGARLLKSGPPTDEARIESAYRTALGRPPTDGERTAVRKFLKAQKSESDAWAGVFHALFASAEFRTAK